MKQNSPPDLLWDYFNDRAARFDSFYDTEGGFLKRIIDGIFRKSVTRRHLWTLRILENRVTGKRVLDVGCGSGRYSVALAKAGAQRVVGVDISPRMLELAARHAKSAGVAERCTFLLGDFLALDCRGAFDFSIAMGFFEYLGKPEAYLKKLAALTSQEVFASFPVRRHWLTPQRKFRYFLRGIPAHFYTEKEILGMVSKAGLTASRMKRLGRDFVLSAVHAR